MSTVESKPAIDLREIAERHMEEGGLFVYESDMLAGAAESLLSLDMPYGLTVRYAAKANPHPEIIALFDEMGLHFDASSPAEASRLLDYGVRGEKISLSSQTLPQSTAEHQALIEEAVERGVLPVATSINQISKLGKLGCQEIAVRINPGLGSGHSNRTNVGGPSSSFGIWHEQTSQALGAATANHQAITRLHTHIGSGADPGIWRKAMQSSLKVVDKLPDVTTLDIGGGYKIARMPGEESTDMQAVGGVFAEELEAYAGRTGREIKLEMEPGTYLVALAGTLIGRVEEKVSTGTRNSVKLNFLKLNVGMNAILRPSLYGAQHPIEVLNDAAEQEEYVVVGPCCESGDILTPAPGDPEGIQPRLLNKAEVGDYVAIGGAGAYCASMSPKGYNDIPQATEIVV